MPIQLMPIGIVFEVAERGPQVGVAVVADVGGDVGFELGPAAGFDEAEDGDERGAGPDEDELQHLIDDGGAQAAEHDVEGDGGGADPDGEVMFQPSTVCMTRAMAYMLTPDMRMVMRPKLAAARPRAPSPKRSCR